MFYRAYCVTSDGSMISGYMVNRWETGDHMDCRMYYYANYFFRWYELSQAIF
jgi:hypothetical protein